MMLSDFAARNKTTLRLIVKAIEKGIGADIRDYITSTNKATNNAVRMMRADNINTNLRNSVVSDTVELKYFNRFSWIGCLLIYRINKVTITICSERTLKSIPSKPDRHVPHFLQSILYVQNGEVKAKYEQMTIPGVPELPLQGTVFSADEYRKDYQSIMEDEISFDDDYRHYVVTYEAHRFGVSSVTLRLLNKDFQNAEEFSLNAFLQPDFADLTVSDNKPKVKDVRTLINVKEELKKSKGTENIVRAKENRKEDEA